MEMRNLDNAPQNDEPSRVVDDPGTAQSLERTDRTALVPQPESAAERSELYARLRTILDTATESIRTLKEENATLATQNTAMSDHIGALEQHLRAVTTDLANDELALRRSAEVLRAAGSRREPDAAPRERARERAARATGGRSISGDRADGDRAPGGAPGGYGGDTDGGGRTRRHG
jgi:hypothetical protein